MTSFPYDHWLQICFRMIVRQALSTVEKEGLASGHQLRVSFLPSYPGVVVPESIVHLQQVTLELDQDFWDLKVTPEYFSVIVIINDYSQKLVVPFGALLAFLDMKAEFGLEMTPLPGNIAIPPLLRSVTIAPTMSEEPLNSTQEEPSTNVISLENFRKRVPPYFPGGDEAS